MKPEKIFSQHQRQIHLDFHTSPHIPDVGVEFDAEEFALTMKKAHVNSVTVFAKCHHGMCYFPTQTGTEHPALNGRDLLGEQIEALHRHGIRAPIYTTIVWEDDVALRHPEWRQLDKYGNFAGSVAGPDGSSGHVAMWQFNNFLDPDYQDYIETHVREIMKRYGKDVDGFFFDILFFAPNAGWSPASLRFREKHDLLSDDVDTFARFQAKAQASFGQRFTKLVQGIRPSATVFYNTHNDGNMDRHVGPRARAPYMTHFEIESLPSGFWGYFHYPRMARALSHWGKPWMGMTGRFQKMWGDFGGVKPQPALEFECFRAQAMGGANSIGDQLPPRGKLDPAAYDLIGAVFGQCAEAEPFYSGSTTIQPKIGIFQASFAGQDGGKSEEGAVLLCEEFHYDCRMLDAHDSLKGYDILILPDTTVVDKKLATALRKFHESGGQLLFSYRSGFSEKGEWALDFLPLSFSGQTELYPTYWRIPSDEKKGDPSDRVMYSQGMNVKARKGAKSDIQRVLPYFNRTAVTYSSHFQTPPVADASSWPATVKGKGFYYFADPIFREYRQTGNPVVRLVWKEQMKRMVNTAPFGDGLPSSMLVYPRKKGKSLLLTLLHYVPVRKAMDIDVIEEPSTFAGEVLRFSSKVNRVKVFPSGTDLPRNEEGGFELPNHKGRLLLEVPGYF